MTIQNIYVGANPNDNTGDTLRQAFIKVNNNFAYVSGVLAAPIFANVTVTGPISSDSITTSWLTVNNTATISNLVVANAATANAKITGGSISNTPISGAAGSFTTLSASGGITGTLQSAAQPNITSLGTLANLTVAGFTNTGSLITSNAQVTGGAISGASGSFTTLAASAGITGTLQTAAQPNITAVGTLGSLTVSGAATTGVLSTANAQITGGAISNTPISGSSGSFTTLSASGASNFTLPTSNVNSFALSSTGNASGVNILLTGNGSTTPSKYLRVINGAFQIVNDGYNGILWALDDAGNQTASGNVSGVNILTATTISSSNISGTLLTQAQPNITSLGTLTSLTVSGTTSLTSTAQSTGTASGALVVSGGAGVSKNLYVGGDTTLIGNLTVLGTQNIVNSQTIALSDPIIDIGTGANNAPLVSDDGMDRGIRAHYYKGSNQQAFFGFQSSTQVFEYLTNTTTTNGVVTGTPGTAAFGGLSISNSTASTSTTTGAAVVTGGIGVGGNVYAGGTFYGNVIATTISGTLQTAAQPNITSVGTLTSLTTSGDITNNGGNVWVKTVNTATSGSNKVSPSFKLVSNYWDGNVSTPDIVNIQSIPASGTNPAISLDFTHASGSSGGLQLSINGHPFVSGSSVFVGTGVSTSGNVTAGNVIATSFYGNVIGTNLTGTIQTAAQPNITSVGTLGSLNVTGTVTAGGFSGPLTGTIQTAAQPNITSVGTLTSLTVSGSATFQANVLHTAANAGIDVGSTSSANTPIINFHSSGNNIAYDSRIYATGGNASVGYGNLTVSTANATFTGNILTSGNVTYNIGSSSNKFGTIYGTATTALYADLAETYAGDASYQPGTVVVFGGTEEVTQSTTFADASVAGAVSTAPAYLMNADAPYAHPVIVALRGRVPVKVVGTVSKGDLLVTSSQAGCAESVGKEVVYGKAIFAKAIEASTDPGVKVITAVIL